MIKAKLRRLLLKIRKHRSTKGLPVLSEPPVWQVPDGLTVTAVGDTGMRVIDNFLSPEEAEGLIKLHGDRVGRSTIIDTEGSSVADEYRTSSDTFIQVADHNPLVQAIVYRAASFFGLPVTHAETFSLTRYQSGEYYKSHYDHNGSLRADRLYTLLIYLNSLDADEGGGTLFNKLNLVTQPVQGRAVVWVNSEADKSVRKESVHSSLPITSDTAEKWVAQLWFRSYPFDGGATAPKRTAPGAGVPLNESMGLPFGVAVPKPEDIPEDAKNPVFD